MGDVAPPGSYRCRHRCHYRRETDAAASRTADHTHAPQSSHERRRAVSRRRAVLTFVFIGALRSKTQLCCLWSSLDCNDDNFYNVLIPTYFLFIFFYFRGATYGFYSLEFFFTYFILLDTAAFVFVSVLLNYSIFFLLIKKYQRQLLVTQHNIY